MTVNKNPLIINKIGNLNMIKLSNFYNLNPLFTAKSLQDIPEFIRIFPSSGNDLPVFVSENFIPEEVCNDLIENILSYPPQKGTVLNNKNKLEVSEEVRKSLIYDLSPKAKGIYNRYLNKVIKKIEVFFDVMMIGGSEGCHAVGYSPGGFYNPHCDNCNARYDNNGNFTKWEVISNKRIISTILVLSDGVEEITGKNQCIGGDLVFNFIFDNQGKQLIFKAKKGLFISFPSQPCFFHEVKVVTEGFRVSLVDWHFALKAK